MAYDIRVVSSYPPRRCGIAEFTRNLLTAVGSSIIGELGSIRVAAIDNPKDGLRYSIPVDGDNLVIDQFDHASWSRVTGTMITRARESKNPLVVILQHEFGFDTDEHGRRCLGHNFEDIARKFRAEKREKEITTLCFLHTVLENPDEHQRRVIHNLGQLCDGLIVTAKSAIPLLEKNCGIPTHKIEHIDHGIRMLDYSKTNREEVKTEYGLEGIFLATNLGMKSPGKGIPYFIAGLGRFIRNFCTGEDRRNVLGMVAGQYHPDFMRYEKEHYKAIEGALERVVSDYGLRTARARTLDDLKGLDFREHDVVFLEGYLDEKTLRDLYCATNVMVLPYLNPDQISSGVLADTLGAGRMAIATRFRYAVELLCPEGIDRKGIIGINDPQARGIIVDCPGDYGIDYDPDDPIIDQISEAFAYITLGRAGKANIARTPYEIRSTIEHKARTRGHEMRWETIAGHLIRYIENLRGEGVSKDTPIDIKGK